MEPLNITELNPPPPLHEGMDKKITRSVWNSRRIVLLGGGFAVLCLVCYVAFFMDRSARLNVNQERLTISEVTRGTFQEYIPVSGMVQPLETFYLDAVEGGRVEERYLEAGAHVTKGQPILKLTNANLQLDVMYREALSYEQINNARNTRIAIEQNSNAVQAQLADVEYQLRRASRAFKRDSALATKGIVSDLDFKQSRDDFQYWTKRIAIARETAREDSILRSQQIGQLEASDQRLQANLTMIKRNLDALIVRAPISGQLSALNAEIGQSKNPGERLGQIDVVGSSKVRADIDEYYVARIRPGQTGEAEIAGTIYKLAVAKVYPEVREGKFAVDFTFGKTLPPEVRRGQTIQLRLELGDAAEAVLLPRGSFSQTSGGQWVYVLDASRTAAVKRAVKLGRQNPQVYEVVDGLVPGDQVITSGYELYGDKDKLILGH